MATTVGTIQLLATIDTSQYKKGQKEIEKSNSDIEKSADTTSKKSNTAFNNVAKVGLAAISAAAVAVGAAIISNVGGAIRRVDTLNNANRTFQNLGFDSVQTAKSMEALQKSIMGLPTPLDSAVRGMTALASTYGDIGRGQKMFTALNNAILGFGGTADMVNNAIMQISQLPMDGPLDAQTWNSLRNSGLTPVLVAMAKDMGKSVNEMKSDFGRGILTVEDFSNALIKMNTDGGGGMKSLETIAKDSTKGIGTSFANMNTAIQRGLANVLTAIGSEDIAKTINNIGKAFETALKETSPFINFIKANQKVITALVITIGTGIGLLTGWYVAVKAITVAQAAWNAVTKANTIGLIVVSVLALAAGFMYLWNNVEGFRKFFIDTWATIKSTVESVVSYISGVWDTVSTNATEVWTTVKDSIVSAFETVKTTIEDVSNRVQKILYDWRYWIQNVGIVITGVLLPKIVSIGIEFAKASAKAVISFVKMSASAVRNAIATSVAWTKSAALTAYVWVTKTLPNMIGAFITMSINAVGSAIKTALAWKAAAITTMQQWAITLGLYLQGLAATVLQTAASAVKIAASWLLAMGPIGLIVAAVAVAAALIIANWDTVKNFALSAWDAIKNAASAVWGWIQNVFGSIGQWFTDRFNQAKNGIIGAFDGVRRAVGDVWQWIMDKFSTIGEIGTSIIRGAVNSVLGFAERTINGFINMINGALDAINKIPGVDIGKIGTLTVPRLAEGGIVPATRGGILANIGEGGEAEAVIPLSKLDKMLSGDTTGGKANIEVTQNIYNEVDMDRAMRDLAWRIAY